jgi:hypothetical protein
MATYVSQKLVDEAGVAVDSWNDLESPVKAAYVVNATRRLDGLVDWIGDRYFKDQKLMWPRVNAWFDSFLLDNTVFPQAVKDATCEMAFWLAQNDGVISTTPDDSYDSIKVGPININFNTKTSRGPNQYAPDSVAILLKGYGVLNNPDIPGASRLKIVRLSRA